MMSVERTLNGRISTQDTQIATLSQRLQSLDERHDLAITHIAEREAWTGRRWPQRPATLPAIPVVLISDVAADPSLRLEVPADPEEPARPRRPPPEQ